jgi:hypothetical protein
MLIVVAAHVAWLVTLIIRAWVAHVGVIVSITAAPTIESASASESAAF